MTTVQPKPGDNIVVWFSHGAASAVAWQETLRRYGDACNVVAVNNPVAEEDEDNIRFGRDVAAWLGRDLVESRSKRFPKASAVEVWDREKAMSFPHGAPCTKYLKKIARQEYEKEHRVDWHVLGFTVDERERHDRFVLSERSNLLPVLIDAGLTKQDCYDRLLSEGINPPRVYAMGYPNANCIGCVKATSPTYWNLVRAAHPEVFAARAEQSRRLGVRLARFKGERVFLDELPADAAGRPLKTMQTDCGIFCEEKTPAAEDRELPRCYFAHPVTDYGGSTRQVESIDRLVAAGWSVVNPDHADHQAGYRDHGMQHFLDAVGTCDALAFLRFPNGDVGAGVGKEIEEALRLGLPVYDVADGMRPITARPAVLTVDDTRALIRSLSVDNQRNVP